MAIRVSSDYIATQFDKAVVIQRGSKSGDQGSCGLPCESILRSSRYSDRRKIRTKLEMLEFKLCYKGND